MKRVNRLVIASAEQQALDLEGRDEKWAALTIVSLLAVIEALTGESCDEHRKAEGWRQ